MAAIMILNTNRSHTIVGTKVGTDDDAVKAPWYQMGSHVIRWDRVGWNGVKHGGA